MLLELLFKKIIHVFQEKNIADNTKWSIVAQFWLSNNFADDVLFSDLQSFSYSRNLTRPDSPNFEQTYLVPSALSFKTGTNQAMYARKILPHSFRILSVINKLHSASFFPRSETDSW